MIISVQGHMIETRNIYTITPVVGNNCWGEPWNIDSDKEPKLLHSGFSFSIKFFNDKDLIIRLNGSDLYKDPYWYTTMEYYPRISAVEDELNKFRDIVVSYWNEGKTSIPILELPTYGQ